MRVTVDTERCCGSGMCVLTAPEIFDQRDEDGIVRLHHTSPEPALHRQVREAAQMCPSGAITVNDEE